MEPESSKLRDAEYQYNEIRDSDHGQPVLSVVIPFYGDYCDFKNTCLTSLVQQKLKNFEVVFVQDGPSALHDTLVSDLKLSGLDVIYITNAHNMGALQSRIIASRRARGQYLAFLDHDDAYESNFLEEMYRSAIEHGADVVECVMKNVGPSGNIEFFHRFACNDQRKGSEILLDYMKGKSHNNLANKILRKELFVSAVEELAQSLPGMKWNFSEDLLVTSIFYKKAASYVATCETHYIYMQRSVSNVNPADLKKIARILGQITIVAKFINMNIAPYVPRKALFLFHRRETCWSLNHMARRLRRVSPRNPIEFVVRHACFAYIRYSKLRFLASPWLRLGSIKVG